MIRSVPGDEAALRRVRPPAIFLLVVSVLNLLAGLYLMVNGIFIKKSGADVEAQMQKQWETAKQEDRDAMKKIGINSPHDLVALAPTVAFTTADWWRLWRCCPCSVRFG